MANGTYRVAKKEHRCDFCERSIPSKSRYWYEHITPWDHPDNDGYGTLRAHEKCHEFWCKLDNKSSWEWPIDSAYWLELMAESEVQHDRTADRLDTGGTRVHRVF